MPKRENNRRTEWLLINPHIVVWGLTFLRSLTAVLSIDAISQLGAYVGRTAGPRTRRHGRAVANIARAFPSLSSEEHNRIARGMWENFGRTVAESFIIDRIASDESRVVCTHPDVVRSALERTGGAIFVGLHFGNWEATIIPAARLGGCPIGIYKPLKSNQADVYLRSLRKNLFPAGLLPASLATLLTVVRHVRAGGCMCMLADHRDKSGTVVSFFGHPAPSSTLPAFLNVKYGLPIFAARVDRLQGARFTVHVEEILGSQSGDQDADVVSTTAAIQAVFERWITARPDQWVWCYKRWQSPALSAPAEALEVA
ncbi:MAG: hypothetical protein WBX25_34940 [Rhodomicrobium sp.]